MQTHYHYAMQRRNPGNYTARQRCPTNKSSQISWTIPRFKTNMATTHKQKNITSRKQKKRNILVN